MGQEVGHSQLELEIYNPVCRQKVLKHVANGASYCQVLLKSNSDSVCKGVGVAPAGPAMADHFYRRDTPTKLQNDNINFGTFSVLDM